MTQLETKSYWEAREIEKQALLDACLAAHGWDPSQFRLDPVWRFRRISNLAEAQPAVCTGRFAGLVQAPSKEYVLDAFKAAHLHTDDGTFDANETTSRLRACNLSEEHIRAAIAFTLLTGGSVFRLDGPEWQQMQQRYRDEHARLVAQHELLITLAVMRGQCMATAASAGAQWGAL